MANLIVLIILAVIIGCAIRYIYKAKKHGVKCIGCPDGTSCSGKCSSCSCGCSGKQNAE